MRLSPLLSAALLTLQTGAFAAYQSYPVRNRIVYNDDGQINTNIRTQYYSFRTEIISDSDGIKSEEMRNGKPFVTAAPGERYAVRLYNPLPVRVAVNLTVDGVNSVSGKPSGISDGEKWIIEPNSFITIDGWQVNGNEARRFFFTNKRKSYAKWRGKQLHEDLAANCGVIGAAFFWSQHELDQYYEDHPIYRPTPPPVPYCPTCERQMQPGVSGRAMDGESLKKEMSADSTMSLVAPAAQAKPQEAGTGMGERESHPTTLVDFQFDTGMFELAKAIVIYYDFAKPVPQPNPFPGMNYAPEM